MNVSRNPPSFVEEMHQLAESCRRHLDAELSSLESIRAVLTQVRDLLARSDNRDCWETISPLTEVPESILQLRQTRQALREELAAALGIPPGEATVRKLIAVAAPNHLGALEEQRAATERTARDVEALTLQVAALARGGMQVFQRIFESLVGGGPAGRYSRQGIEEQAPCGGLLHTRC